MTSLHSWRQGEAHLPWHSASHPEPPTSIPPNFGRRGFYQGSAEDAKLEELCCFVTDKEVDIFGFTEANKYWDLLPDQQRLPTKTRGWWETAQWSLSYNRMEQNAGQHQPGGTGLLCVNQVAHRTTKPSDDPLGLGWWCWIRIRGTGGFAL